MLKLVSNALGRLWVGVRFAGFRLHQAGCHSERRNVGEAIFDSSMTILNVQRLAKMPVHFSEGNAISEQFPNPYLVANFLVQGTVCSTQ